MANISKLVVAMAIIIAVLLAVTNYTQEGSKPILGVAAPREAEDPSEVRTHTLHFQGEEYQVLWLLAAAERTQLIANFGAKDTAWLTFDTLGCKLVTNAGFYSIDKYDPTRHSAIGLFVADGEVFSEYRQNSLLDGVFSINEFAVPRISRGMPSGILRQAVQSGPILQENDTVSVLKLVRDKESRRSVVAVTGDNELIFMIIYKADSALLGPKLADLPELLALFESESQVQIADAINLDGGAASAFIATDAKVSEISPVGGFFCVR